MPSLSPRALLRLGLLVGLTAGCAHPQKTSPTPSHIPTVTAADIERSPGDPIEKVLAGRVSGVALMRRPDGGIAVRIRGTTSVNGNTEPLYVIDGLPIVPGPGGSLTGINPYDIESIKVLKDPIDISEYGIRGANGVILITTKRPD
jgi:TonB-dependent SusC/RagA subfamily outer membrane receptor